MSYLIEDLLKKFTESAFQGPIPYSLQHDWKESQCHLLTICATHGDEIGSLPSALKFFKKFTEKNTTFKGKWTLIWGNPQASQVRQRFIEKDLNRLYGKLDHTSLESKRASEIAPIIKTAHFFVDFHQTIIPTLVPFYCARDYKKSYHLARALGGITNLFLSPKFLQEDQRNNFKNHPEIKTQNDFATWHGIPSLTVEIGIKGFNRSSELMACHLFEKLINIASHCFNFSEDNTLENFAMQNPSLSIFKCVYKQIFDDPEMSLNSGFKNFSPIQEGEIIGYKDRNKKFALLAPQNGVIIFPKYPQRDEQGIAKNPLPEYLYCLANVLIH